MKIDIREAAPPRKSLYWQMKKDQAGTTLHKMKKSWVDYAFLFPFAMVFVAFYIPGLLFGVPMRNRMLAALIAFVINYSAYFSEIYRGGIEAIPRGQKEAGQVLGMTKVQIFFKIELLQVIKRILPPMGNEIITLIKDTSLANVIAVMDITMTAKTFTNQGLVWPLFYSGLFYLAFCGLLTILFSKLEKKLDFFKI